MPSNVVKLSDYQEYLTRADRRVSFDVKPEAQQIDVDEEVGKAEADFAEIYPQSDESATFVTQVRKTLLENEQRLHSARSGDAIDRDDAINALKRDLPELFVQDKWNDGGLAVIVALYHSLRNRKGDPLKFTQFIAVSAAVKRLADAPFMTFDQALDVVDSLTAAKLNTEPEEAVLVQEMLHE